MKMIRLLMLAPFVMTAGCVPDLVRHDPDNDAIVKTQVPVDQLAACIGAAAGTTPAPSGDGGYQVDLSATAPGRSVLIARSKTENVVKQIGDQSALPNAAGLLIINCTLKLTPASYAQ